ncbi:hypothetical protein J2X31_000745 [Flavobacterium arsenatis]|uniref:Outer membrane protein beta-barrel domain-containing protein n=1 Tax=Flavobacterium arsenatis TaxID=1484332 RepID=A0ABU1TLP8_9FLAO|nr:porin family protein [Flavobacterium arsenatis]MDR6966747.1 hypothetical protein [Flavobacterium arsenatis]
MKKYLLLLLMGVATFAQEKPKFGINLGSTFSNIRESDSNSEEDFFYENTKYDLNFLVGVSMELPLGEKFSLLGNVNYERKTFKKTKNLDELFLPNPDDPNFNQDRTVDMKQRLEYITIPINLKYYLDAQKRFYVNGGPFIGFFLNSNLKTEGKNVNDNGDSIFKTLDFGANLGIGTNFKINEKNSLNLELRHNYGFVNIADFNYNDTKLKTNSFNLIANWQFDL